uniref:Cadherin domain-containing protein n=1 Tax=Cyprinus carpio TaxID=7962 RepID=A0A8C2HZ03_CYPCA
MSDRTMARQVLLFIWFLSLSSVLGQVSYSIPEEMAKGSLVGNIAQDLGLDLKRLKSGKARIYTGDSVEYLELTKSRGVLLIKERIDREALCGQTTPCALHLQITLENPMEFYSVTVEVLDVNDNAPVFAVKEIKFDIIESSLTGAKFVLERAVDDDVGLNGVQSYSLQPVDHFVLKTQDMPDGTKNVEMILQKPLDREKQEHFSLLLTAVDGGDPQMSGTIPITITVEDANDNAPVCFLPVYKTSVAENSPKGTILTTVQASDADQGQNGRVEYYIYKSQGSTSDLFEIDKNEGVLRLSGETDYERVKHFQIDVQARDPGRHSDTCKVIVDIIDVNDNKPVINIMSKPSALSEDLKSGTVVTMLNVQDSDSGENGKVQCSINDNIPFTLTSTTSNFFSLVTDGDLDRERESGYNISVTCADEGVPSLSSSVILSLHISDVNDNAPVFEKSSYEASVQENNTPGLSIFTVRARDADFNQNARVSYIVEDSSVNGVPVSSLVSVSADSGVIHAVRSFDYEQIKDFQFRIKAQDTDRALFEVGLQNGEIRTVRQVTDKDAVKQRLTVVVEDNGQPSPSATVNVNVAVADSFPEVLSEFTDFPHKDYNDNLTFYLVLALAVVSFLFIVSIIAILSVKCYRWRREQMFYKSGANLPVIPYYPPLYADVGGTGTLQHVYNYEVCRTTDSRKSDLKYERPCSESIISLDSSGTQTLTHAQKQRLNFDDCDDQQKPPSADWRFTQNQRPGPSGAAGTPEVAVGTGPWPNPPTEAEQLQALMAAANEVSEATNTLGPGTMGLSTRYNPQFTLQHVPDYRQNVYIPGSTATLTSNQQQPQQALPPPQAAIAAAAAQPEPPKAAQTPANKKKSTKKEKK